MPSEYAGTTGFDFADAIELAGGVSSRKSPS
jgi:hypothetical protein